MRILVLQEEFSICKLPDLSEVNIADSFCFIGKTDEELSLVCSSDHVPGNAFLSEDGWRAFRIEGILDFSLVGILAKITGLLAEAGIGIFAVSTYNTDYVLTKADCFERALAALAAAGYEVVR